MASDEWIQESLARVEALDNERSKLEEALEEASDAPTIERLSKRLDALEGEYNKLMQALESAAEEAGDDDDDADDADGPAAAVEEEVDNDAPTGLFSRDDMARMAAEHAAVEAAKAAPKPAAPAPPKRAPAPVPGPQAAPPPQAPPSVPPPAFAAPFPSSSMGDEGSRAYRGSDLDDDASKSKGPLIGILAAAVVAIGVIGYLAFGRGGGGEDTTDPAAGPKKVIGGGVEVPPDTQGPKAAKGTNVDSVTGTQFKEGQRPSAGRPSGGTPGGATPTKKKPDEKTKIVNTDDPLAGIDTK